jgi:hypothetical protein
VSRPRKYNYEQIRRLHGRGLSYGEIARREGTYPANVMRICDAAYREAHANKQALYRLERRTA